MWLVNTYKPGGREILGSLRVVGAEEWKLQWACLS